MTGLARVLELLNLVDPLGKGTELLALHIFMFREIVLNEFKEKFHGFTSEKLDVNTSYAAVPLMFHGAMN